MKKLFFRLGVTMELTEEEFALICTSSDAAHDLLREKVARDEDKSQAAVASEYEFPHEDDIEFYF